MGHLVRQSAQRTHGEVGGHWRAGVRGDPWGTGELRGLEHLWMADSVRWGLGHLGWEGAIRGWGNPGGQKCRGL